MVYGKLNLYYLIIFHNIQIIFTTRKSLKFYCTKFLPFEKKNENNIKTFTTRHIALTKEFLHALIRCNKIIVNIVAPLRNSVSKHLRSANVLIIALNRATLAVSIARFKKLKRANWKCKLDRDSSPSYPSFPAPLPAGCLTFRVLRERFQAFHGTRMDGKGKRKILLIFPRDLDNEILQRPEIEYFLCITGFKRSNVLAT